MSVSAAENFTESTFNIMKLSEYKKIPLADIEASILTQITEEQVGQWLAARLLDVRKTIPLANDLQGTTDFRRHGGIDYIDLSWTVHGGGKVGMTQPSISTAMDDLKEELAGNPKERAAALRWEAKRLLAQAGELESVA